MAVVGSIVAALLLLLNQSPDHAGGIALARTNALSPSASTARLTFGMTQQQVRQFTGRPASTLGNCWRFHPTKTGMVGSIPVQASFATVPYDTATSGDLKLCFSGGAFSFGYLHGYDKQKHRWVWEPWPLALAPSH